MLRTKAQQILIYQSSLRLWFVHRFAILRSEYNIIPSYSVFFNVHVTNLVSAPIWILWSTFHTHVFDYSLETACRCGPL
jgi:hypothetical protein